MRPPRALSKQHLDTGEYRLFLQFNTSRYRVRRLRTRQKELGELVEVRTRDLKKQYVELEKARQKIEHAKELIEAKNKQLEDQSGKLKEMDIIKSRFFANISHEFRTPLTLIMGPLEQMIAACPENDPEKKKRLALMMRNAHRLLRLINQLLELSKLDSGKMKLQAVKTPVISFIKAISDSFRLLADQKKIGLVFHTRQKNEEDDILLYIDPRKMEDIMSNLLMNALKFTPPEGQVTVSVKPQAGAPEFVEISVSDTGPGMPAEQSAHIFDRFYQADATYEMHQKGSGIGLALAKELVELHQGTIQVHSREAQGAEFVIRLPVGDAHLKPVEIAGSLESPHQPEVRGGPADHMGGVPADIQDLPDESVQEEHEEEVINGNENENGNENGKDIVLVVEDSADVREYIRGSLEPLHTVMEAKDGREGIRKAVDIVPDLIISDIMMPRANGYELCRELKNNIKTSHIPIILLTAKASEENIIRGLETRADDYITKPFSTTILLARIKNLIDLRRHMQQTVQRDMALQPAEIPVSSIDQKFITELQEMIEKNLSDTLFSVEKLGKKLYMSRASLYRKIFALTGESPREFIKSYRLKRGAQLLKDNFGNVTEVAFEVGFSSTAYFTKCFKEKFHQLPHAYQVS
jgi:signal transduction histidine kinase/DNA-binding response OmpR family regulator